MNDLSVLIKMQLKEKLNFKGKNLKSKSAIFNGILNVLKFIVITALCYALLFICNLVGLFSLLGRMPASVIAIVFFIMFILQTISAGWSLTKNLYFSQDNPILLVFPCRNTKIYFSKLIVFYLFEFMRNMSFMIPLFTAYGLISGLSILYYLWMLFCFIFISMFPVLIGAMLSIPLMWFYSFLKQYKRVQFSCVIALVTILVIILTKGINLIPQNINISGAEWAVFFTKIQGILETFKSNYSVIYKLVKMVTGDYEGLKYVLFDGSNFIAFFQMILVLSILFVIGYSTVRPLFYVMASKPLEHTKKNNKKQKENVPNSKIFSIIKTETLLNLRDSSKVFNNIVLMVSMPILIFLLNKILGAMDTKLLGNVMAVAFNILIMLLISLSSNYTAASAFSRDGKSSYLIKVQPSQCQTLLLSKLIFNAIFMITSFIATGIVLATSDIIETSCSVILVIGCVFIYFAHLCYSAELDVMHQKIELYTTTNENTNPNETKSTIVAFFASFLVFAIMLLLLIENSSIITYVKMLIIGLVIFAMRFYLLLTNIKLYYKENE